MKMSSSFRLILSFQFIKAVKNELFVLLKKQKKDCVLSIRSKFKKYCKMTSFNL